MCLENKRGLSPIVATVLLVMLTILAVAVLSSFIVPFIRDSLDKSTKCSTIDSAFAFDESSQYNCKKIGQSQVNVTISVTRNSDESSIGGFLAVFYEDGFSNSIRVVNGASRTQEISMLDATEQTLELPKPGETRSYIFNTTSTKYNRAEIRTVTINGDVCEKVSDRIEIPEC